MSALGFWGLTRIPTAFIPIDDQGYLMVAVQLPEGASLGRTTARSRAPRPAGHPRRGQVIAIGHVGARQQCRLANSGTAWIMLKPFDERTKAPGQDLLSIYQNVVKALASLPDGQAFVLPPPPIQGIGNAGGFQMQLEMLGGSFDYKKLATWFRRWSNRPKPIRGSATC